MSEFAAEIDIRKYSPKDRHPTVAKTFKNLEHGAKMLLINDHEMSPLLNHFFNVDHKDQFIWEPIENGPEVWRVSITKK